MTVMTRISLCFLATFLVFCQVPLSAQRSEQQDNLWACKSGLDSCDRSALTAAESHDIAVSTHKPILRIADLAKVRVIEPNLPNSKSSRWPSLRTRRTFQIAWTVSDRAIIPRLPVGNLVQLHARSTSRISPAAEMAGNLVTLPR